MSTQQITVHVLSHHTLEIEKDLLKVLLQELNCNQVSYRFIKLFRKREWPTAKIY